MEPKYVFWFNEVGQADNDIVGKKCANLGEMTKLGMPVPHGFAISIAAHERFLNETGARDQILELLNEIGECKDIDLLADVSKKIREIIEKKEMPSDLAEVISSYYQEMCLRQGCEIAVSVRSAGAKSHPGMYETYLNIKGTQQVLEMVKKVWSSIFNHRTICTMVQHGLPIAKSPSIGVGVVELINARCAGVCFTVHPVSGDPSKAVIEANWGLGESVVSGMVSVDTYIVNKETLEVVEKNLGEKRLQIVPRRNGIVEEEVPPEMQNSYVLADKEAAEIVRLGKILESHFNQPQDIEWAIATDRPFPNNIFLLQTRPVVGVTIRERNTGQRIKVELAKRMARLT